MRWHRPLRLSSSCSFIDGEMEGTTVSTETRSSTVQALIDTATRLPGWLHRHAFYSRQEAARRPEVAEHAYAVALYAWELAGALRFDAGVAYDIHEAARLHDIGKISIDDRILYKPGRLTPAESAEMKLHAAYGYALLSVDGAPPLYAEIAKYHHERYDGTGYNGLKGEDIPISARIVQIADVYEALSAKRSYKEQMRPEDALAAMIADAPTPAFGRRAFDPGFLRVFVRMRLENDPSLAPGDPAGLDFAARMERSEKIQSLHEFAGSDPMLDFAPGELPQGLVLKASGARLLYDVDDDGRKTKILAVVQSNGAVIGDMPEAEVRAALSLAPRELEDDTCRVRACY
jgi:putative two-component system response regulator